MIDRAIVKALRLNKRLDHYRLVHAVFDKLFYKFSLKIQTIKERIDILIEKQYLERVEGHIDTYQLLEHEDICGCGYLHTDGN